MPLTIATLFAEFQPAPVELTPTLRVAHALASLADAFREAEAAHANNLARVSQDAWLFEEG